MNGGPLRAHVRATTTILVEDGQVRAGTVESQEIASFSCADHPEFLWNGSQWSEVLKHLVMAHAEFIGNGVVENRPFHDGAQVGEEVQVGVEPPGGEDSDASDDPPSGAS